jgi:hypothetical protein
MIFSPFPIVIYEILSFLKLSFFNSTDICSEFVGGRTRSEDDEDKKESRKNFLPDIFLFTQLNKNVILKLKNCGWNNKLNLSQFLKQLKAKEKKGSCMQNRSCLIWFDLTAVNHDSAMKFEFLTQNK